MPSHSSTTDDMNGRLVVNARLERLVGHYQLLQDNDLATQLERATGHYLLVEESRHNGRYWLTRHNSLDDAGDYRDGQEHPEDWRVVALIDLTSGEHFYDLVSTDWFTQGVLDFDGPDADLPC